MSDAQNQGIFKVGDVLNNTYRIEKVLGRGGTSEVYKARSEISGREVALKALRQEFSRNDDFLALMRREEEMREIRHDAVVRYYDNQRTEDGLIYLVMDYVEGPDLNTKIKQGGMSADDLITVARRVTEGLVAAHAKKIVHRDLSPDNIILRHGDPADAVIIDFGIAKDTNEGAQTIVGNEFAGKYAYAAPEQLSGQTDARADIYALGALLLATFRGAAPRVGANPMEVIAHKARPLDTNGVPEPLKTLIDQMTLPDRDARLQTAQSVLEQIDSKTRPAVDASEINLDDEDPEKTVVAPVAVAPRDAPIAVPKPETPLEKHKPAVPAKSSGGGGKIAAFALVLLTALGAGGYFSGALDGFLGPQYPTADPYLFEGQRLAGQAPTVTGNVPSVEVQDDIHELMDNLGGQASLTLASGDLPVDWGSDMWQLIGILSVLPEWRVTADGAEVTVTGHTDDADQHTQLMALFNSDGLPGGLVGTPEILYEPPILTADTLTATFAEYENCGALSLVDAPALGYGPEDQVFVSGKVADVATRATLSDALVAAIGDRDLLLNVDVLNPTLCQVDAVLPKAPSGGFEITFLTGADGAKNPSGRFFVGENPMIDVTIPADVTTGYLFVSAADATGNVFHLLPNTYIEGNDIADLRKGTQGPVNVRVADSLAEGADDSKLAFEVDESALGKTNIIVIYSEDQIFSGLRPTVESAGGYAEALKNYVGVVRSIDSRILETARP